MRFVELKLFSHVYISHLEDHVDDDDKERIGEVVQEPDFNGFDDWSAGQTVGHGQVDRGQHHHARDVHGDDQIVPVRHRQVVCGLVDDVHQDGWEVGHHEDAEELLSKAHRNFQHLHGA